MSVCVSFCGAQASGQEAGTNCAATTPARRAAAQGWTWARPQLPPLVPSPPLAPPPLAPPPLRPPAPEWYIYLLYLLMYLLLLRLYLHLRRSGWRGQRQVDGLPIGLRLRGASVVQRAAELRPELAVAHLVRIVIVSRAIVSIATVSITIVSRAAIGARGSSPCTYSHSKYSHSKYNNSK